MIAVNLGVQELDDLRVLLVAAELTVETVGGHQDDGPLLRVAAKPRPTHQLGSVLPRNRILLLPDLPALVQRHLGTEQLVPPVLFVRRDENDLLALLAGRLGFVRYAGTRQYQQCDENSGNFADG